MTRPMARQKTPEGYCPKCRRPLPREKKDNAARRWRINGDVVVEAVTAYQAWERGRAEGLLRGKFFECTFEELKDLQEGG